MAGIQYPVGIKKIGKFEHQNINLNINVYGLTIINHFTFVVLVFKFTNLFYAYRHVCCFLPGVISVMVNNWKLSWDHVSPALKHKTKHSDKALKKQLKILLKIKHKSVKIKLSKKIHFIKNETEKCKTNNFKLSKCL